MCWHKIAAVGVNVANCFSFFSGENICKMNDNIDPLKAALAQRKSILKN
jgi:hypothetical protein